MEEECPVKLVSALFFVFFFFLISLFNLYFLLAKVVHDNVGIPKRNKFTMEHLNRFQPIRC